MSVTESMESKLWMHLGRKPKLGLVALTGAGAVWVLDGEAQANPERGTVPVVEHSGESPSVVLQRLAALTLGARVRTITPLREIRPVADTAFFAAWLPPIDVPAPAEGARVCRLRPGDVPSIVSRVLGKDLDEPSYVAPPHVRVLRVLNRLQGDGFANLTVRSWTDDDGWHLEVIPGSLLSPPDNFARMVEGRPPQRWGVLSDWAVDYWRKQLAGAHVRPIQHHGHSNQVLFGLAGSETEIDKDVAARLLRENREVCWSGFGLEPVRWLPDLRGLAAQAASQGPPEFHWREAEDVRFPWVPQ